MAKKELVIDSAKGTNPGTVNQWTPLTNANEFIGGILTPPLTASTNIGALVSGIPSAFARVDLFHNAIKNGKEDQKTAGTKNLNTYYIELLNEWKGMIAALALDYASFEVRKIDLAYSDGKTYRPPPICMSRKVRLAICCLNGVSAGVRWAGMCRSKRRLS